MNQHRLSRLKRLATGAALISSALALGDDPKPSDKPSPGPPIRMNSPGPQAPVAAVDAGVKEEPTPKPDDRPHVNSPPPAKPVKPPKPPNVNSPPPTTK